jgi:oligopeptide/dipeptide ABC transporter ATP-binding protein
VPDPEHKKKQRIMLKGDVPSPLQLPTGCVFHPRCLYARERCRVEIPQFEEYEKGRQAACHFIKEMKPLENFVDRA